MENASKALIIAGAILLSILIISLGIIIYRQASGIVNNNSMDEFSATTFNTKFTQYTGDSVRATVVRSLIDQVNASNATYEGEHEVTVYNGEGSDATAITSTKNISSTGFYKVYVPDDGYEAGYIKSIVVEKINSETTGVSETSENP